MPIHVRFFHKRNEFPIFCKKQMVMMKKNSKRRLQFMLLVGLTILAVAYFHGIPCFFHAVVGLPTPGCGLTRALRSAIAARFAEAFFFHPLWVIMPPLLLLFILHAQPWHCIPIVERIMQCDPFWWILLGIVLVVYIIRMIAFFPNTPPLDLNRNSLLMRLFRQILTQAHQP